MSCSRPLSIQRRGKEWGTQIEHKPFFLRLFRPPRDIPAKSRDIPPKGLVSLGFEGHTEVFGPHPSRGRPPPHPNISGPKSLGLGSFSFPESKLPRSIPGVRCSLHGSLHAVEHFIVHPVSRTHLQRNYCSAISWTCRFNVECLTKRQKTGKSRVQEVLRVP